MGLRAVFFISVLLAGAARAGDNLADIERNDTCWYDGGYARCGDQCIDWEADCQCGNETFQPRVTDQYCCLSPGGSCTSDVSNAVCNEGRTLSMSSRCENTNRDLTCYNSYQDTRYIGDQFHFSCPNTCVHWADMCRGLDWCPEELGVCGPDLRCPDYDKFTKHNVTTSAGSAHYYCVDSTQINTNQYDSIDRRDEKQLETEGSALDIDISSFTPCYAGNNPGVMCGPSELDCRVVWCNEANAAQCNTTSGLISTTDSRLCSNPEVWQNVSCNTYLPDGRVRNYGSRCTSSNMACTYPWYTYYDGDDYKPKCSDRSDEIFEEGLTCRQHRKKQIEFHQEKFCNINYPEVQYEPICINKTQWLLENPSKSDPHNCQSSCANSSSGLDCVACSNSSYFSCFKSGHCVPPALVCDGHPQCPNGEDENLDLDNCHLKYIENNIVEPYASYRCNSTFYGGMEIFATPCNNKTECADGSGKSL